MLWRRTAFNEVNYLNLDFCKKYFFSCIFTGKMEMFSKRFPALVKEVFNRSDLHILATIPVKVSNGPLATLLDTLKKNPDCQLIEVTKNNRNELLQEVCSILQWNIKPTHQNFAIFYTPNSIVSSATIAKFKFCLK